MPGQTHKLKKLEMNAEHIKRVMLAIVFQIDQVC